MTTVTSEDDSAASSPEEILIVGVAASCVVFELRRRVEENCTRCGRSRQARGLPANCVIGEARIYKQAC